MISRPNWFWAVAVLVLHISAACCAAGDCNLQDDAAMDESKQQLHLKISFVWPWVSTQLETSYGGSSILEEHLKKISSAHVKFLNNDIEFAPVRNDSTVVTNTIRVKGDSRSSKEKILTEDLLMFLKNLVDCDQRCELSSDGREYSIASSAKLNQIVWEPQNLLFTRRVGVILVNSTNQTDPGGNLDCKELCDQISSTQNSNSNGSELVADIYDSMSAAVARVGAMLDPSKWFALIMVIWLVVCLVIAIMIKRQDRRKLRLHLQERAEYSFSKPRDRP